MRIILSVFFSVIPDITTGFAYAYQSKLWKTVVLLLCLGSPFSGVAEADYDLGPNGSILGAYPSSQDSFLVTGTFTAWNTSQVIGGVVRMLLSGVIDPRFKWEGDQPDYVVDEQPDGTIFTCKGQSGQKANKLILERRRPNGTKEKNRSITFDSPEDNVQCRGLILFNHSVAVSVVIGPTKDQKLLLIDRDLDGEPKVVYSGHPGFDNQFMAGELAVSGKDSHLYFVTGDYNDLGGWAKKHLYRVDTLGNLDPHFYIDSRMIMESGYVESQLAITEIEGKTRIFFGNALYDDQGNKIPIDIVVRGQDVGLPNDKVCALAPILNAQGSALLIGITKAIGNLGNPCREQEPVGFVEVSLQDGSKSKPFWIEEMERMGARAWHKIFANREDSKSYRVFHFSQSNSWNDRPVYSFVEGGGADPRFKMGKSLWQRRPTEKSAPKTLSGVLPTESYIFARNDYGADTVALKMNVRSDQSITIQEAINAKELVPNAFDRFKLSYDSSPVEILADGKGFFSADGKIFRFSPDGTAVAQADLGNFDFWARFERIGSLLYMLTNQNDRLKLAVLDPDTLTFSFKADTGYSHSGACLYPLPGGKEGLLQGKFYRRPEGSATYSAITTLLKINLDTGLSDSGFRDWSHPPETTGAFSGKDIYLLVLDPVRPGYAYVAGTINPGRKVFFGRILPNGEPDPTYWSEGTLGSIPRAIVPLKSGEVYLAGVSKFQGQPVRQLIRLKPDLTIDESFDIGVVGFEKASANYHYREVEVDSVYKLSEESDDLLVFGEFWSVQSVTSPYCVRLNRQGKIVDFKTGKPMCGS